MACSGGRARDLGLDVRPVPALRRSVRPIADLRAVQHLRRALREIAPDVVHTHSSKAGVLGRLAASAEGLPVVHTIHGWSSICGDQGHATRAGVVGIERWLARRTARLVVVTEVDRTIGLAAGIGRNDQYALVRSPLDAADAVAARPPIERREPQPRSTLGPDDFVVGSVARLAAPKDPFTLLRAFGRLSSARPESMLVLIGGGPLEDALRRRGSRRRDGRPPSASSGVHHARPSWWGPSTWPFSRRAGKDCLGRSSKRPRHGSRSSPTVSAASATSWTTGSADGASP